MNTTDPVAPPPAEAATWQTHRLVRRFTWLVAGAIMVVALATVVERTPLTEARRTGVLGVMLASLLIALAGLTGTLAMTSARWRQASGWTDRLRLPSPAVMARQPQAIIVPALSAAAIVCAWFLRPRQGLPDPTIAPALGGALIALGFPLLIAERVMAARAPATLPESPQLAALLRVPLFAIPLAGGLEIAGGLGASWAPVAIGMVLLLVALAATELALRASANWFLPPGGTDRAATASLLAGLLQPGRLRGGLAGSLRDNFGIDFARSWALRWLRDAVLPVLGGIAVLAWGLTGVALIGADERGIYERLGMPHAVWPPGLHVGLPWPMAQVRRMEFGQVHALALGGGDAVDALASPAESAPPATADRLWERPHPAELAYLIASESAGRQGFQTVSVDLRIIYRTGLDDSAALLVAYGQTDPEALVRGAAGRLIARHFARRTLDAVMGEGRLAMAETLRAEIQVALDARAAGIEVVAVVIEAIHPPAGAADAYHGVQAAEIGARASIATEIGQAAAASALSHQKASELTDAGRATAAETIGAAEIDATQFAADRAASHAGGQSFLLERYLANLATALAKSPLTVIDHRLSPEDTPSVDLRPLGTAAAANTEDD